jgi:DNA polymerase IV
MMAPYRKILHIDLDAFFCAVEERLDPSLRGQAFAVGGSPEGRGVVTSCSYAARKFGIKSAMPMIRAIRLYPKLKVVKSHNKDYSDSSKEVMAILKNFTPLFEQISIDEAFLDVTDLPQSGLQIAKTIQTKVFQDLHLPCSIGISTNKLVAKIATNIGKSRNKGLTTPMAILEVEAGREQEFLATLPIEEMWGIGPKTAAQIKKIGIFTIGDIVKRTEADIFKHFGKYGKILYQHAKGIDERPVAEEGGIKSVSNEITFFRDQENEKILLETMTDLCTKIGFRLRKKSLSGYSVKLKIRWPDFQTQTRQVTLLQPTNHDSVIIGSVRKLFYQCWKKGMKVRLIGVGISHLCEDFQQLSFFDQKSQKEQRLLEAVDQLHQKFGEKAIQRGTRKRNYRDWKE